MKASYFKALDGTPLYGVYHEPTLSKENSSCNSTGGQATSGTLKRPVLICPPLFEERKSAYAPLRKLAEALSAAGHAVLRFDYRGSGESGGSSSTRLWRHLLEDVSAAQVTLSKLSGTSAVTFMGLRLGATLALYAAEAAQALQKEAQTRMSVIALAPLLKGSTQVRLWKMRSKIRAELSAAENETFSPPEPAPIEGIRTNSDEAVFDFDGYEVLPAFFEEIAALDPCNDLKEAQSPTLILQLSHRTDLAPETQTLLTRLNKMGEQTQALALRIEAFWDKLDDVDTTPLEQAVLKFTSVV